MGKGEQRPMTLFIKIVFGVLSVTPCLSSRNLDCTKLTTSCPTADQWSERGKLFNCPGNKKYVCLMAPGKELREGCIFNFTIRAKRVGCPYTKKCDIRTDQPLLVAHNNYLHCPPDLDGCPPRNHSGYSILEIYKYARCQGRNTSGERFVSPDEVTGIPTTITPSKIPRHVNWTLNIISIAVGFITVSLIGILIACRNKIERSISKDSEVLRKMSFCSVSSNCSESSLPLLSGHQYDNAPHHSTITCSLDIKLHDAASNGNIDRMKKLIDAKADVNAKSQDQNTPLHKAAFNGHMDIVKILIDAKADVDAQNVDQDTPLHNAASNGHIDIVKILIDAKADVNAKGQDQNTPLHKAAFNGHMDIVKILIDAKADVDVQNVDQNTPLHKAAFNGHMDIVKILIDAKADVDAQNVDHTPLHNAASNGHIDIVKILIAAKADVNAKGQSKNTPLHKAALNGHSDTVKILIDAKADVGAQNLDQDTPLHMAASNGDIDIVKILIDAKADVNAKDQCQKTQLYKALNLIRSVDDVALLSLDQDTPLHNAASNGHIDIVKILIDAKGDVNAKGQGKNTPLHKAALNGHSDTVKILIHAKADVDAQNVDLNTPLHVAASNGNIDTVKILVDANADVNVKGQDHNTPLHNAASNGHTDIVKILIDAKGDVNAKGQGQNTPLHMAVLNRHSDAVKILIDAKADIDAQNLHYITPLHMAASKGHIDIVKILIDAKADINAKDQFSLYDQTTLLQLAALKKRRGAKDYLALQSLFLCDKTTLLQLAALMDSFALQSWFLCDKTTLLQLAAPKKLSGAKDSSALQSLRQNTPLHKAAFNGHVDIVKILIDAKANVDAQNGEHNTPLYMAASNNHIETAKILIDAKADVNGKGRNTPLYVAASKGHTDTVKILIDAKADVSALGEDYDTPLHKAAENGNIDMVKILIDAKADVNATGGCRDTPLHKAASKGRGDIVKILIDAKAGVNVKDWYQDTPLHKAAASGHIDTVKTLINAKADVNAMGQGKNTPLHEASRYSRAEIIEILLSSGADVLIRNKKGEIAEQLGNLQSKQAFKDCYRKVPNEIKRIGNDAIKQCLKSLNEDAVIANVVSCMVVGHVGAGKTTLVNNLLGLPRKKTKMTNGIDLQTGKIFANVHTGEWHIQVDEQTEKIIGQNDITEINVWDFDGKMMYYTMHQDHLSPQRLYFLVFNASLGMDGIVEDHSVDPYSKGKRSLKDHIDLWVTTITTYFQSDGRGFPKIAIVGTHIDKLTDTLKISRIIEEIKIKFQPLVDEWRLIVHEDLFINALDMNAEAIKRLRDVIISCGKSCLQYGQMIPLSWNDLHQQLILRKSENVIAFDELERMNSQMEKPLNEKELILCIEYFHRLGHLLFFNDEEMKDHIVLDPTWITNSMLSFITCSKSTSENGRVQKWLLMQTTGIIEHAYSSEESLTNTETRDRRNLHRFMKKLDLVSKPKVYNAEGFEECQNYFYMPCIVNRDISPYALSLIENQEAVHVSFSFSTVIPPAVYNRLVASSLSLWPVFDNHIYNGIIILRSGPLHLIAFRREERQINISVVHLQDQRHITSCLCRTIVQFAEERLTWIFSNYNISTMETKSLFHITYNSTAAESLKARKIKEEDELCEDRCNSELTQTASYIVNDLFLMRVALMLQDYDIYMLAAKVYKHESAADDLQSDYKELRKSDIAWLILMEWKGQVQNGKRTPTLLKLRNEACINSHILCKVMRFRDEHPYCLDPAYLQTDVHSELLHAVADRISSEYIHVGLELELKADDILKLLKKFKGRTIEMIRAMLQEWYDKNRDAGHVKVVTLATALLNARCDISVLHEFEKLHDRNRQTARQK